MNASDIMGDYVSFIYYIFNICIYINNIFLLINGTEICNYADDTTLYSCDYEVPHSFWG